MVTEANKTVVRRLVDEVLNGGRLEVIDELYVPELVAAARGWIGPFRASFPDVHMEIVELIAEGDKVVGRFTCSATQLGAWLGQAPTGRRFERVDEVAISGSATAGSSMPGRWRTPSDASSSSAWPEPQPEPEQGGGCGHALLLAPML